jgi:hypothetical protein
MKHNLLTTAPKYCPDAIPTARGWVHPVTSELLHAIKLDLTQFNNQAEEQTKSVVDVEPAVVEPAVVEPAVVEPAVVEPAADESADEPKPAKASKTSKA